jgi:hypothetical protein
MVKLLQTLFEKLRTVSESDSALRQFIQQCDAFAINEGQFFEIEVEAADVSGVELERPARFLDPRSTKPAL